jgi:hypothetical protein
MDDSKPLSTLMSTTTVLDADKDGEPMDHKECWSMIGSLVYLMATRPDIQFFCVCALVSGIAEDFTPAGHQVDLYLSSIYSRAWSLVLDVLFSFDS